MEHLVPTEERIEEADVVTKCECLKKRLWPRMDDETRERYIRIANHLGSIVNSPEENHRSAHGLLPLEQ
jgi:hypothetical protein